ncbi:MAG: hypothetical protein SPI71_02790 [Acidaminococcaceae bacterium]|nr:hypothetical protein [Acidaminococcaceae bacterium]
MRNSETRKPQADVSKEEVCPDKVSHSEKIRTLGEFVKMLKTVDEGGIMKSDCIRRGLNKK